jgi:hypothetical protein
VNSQQLFYLNIVMGAFFIAYIVFGRSKQKPPTKLNMRAANHSDIPQTEKSAVVPEATSNDVVHSPRQTLLEPESNQGLKPSKQLSIFFMYNGHDWEAHEVLGIPQGSGVDVATKAYQDQLKTAQPSTYEFLECAYNAIFKKRRNERL